MVFVYRSAHSLHHNFHPIWFFLLFRLVLWARACVRTVEHCIEVWANRCQYNSMGIYGFAANVEDDITQLYVYTQYAHAHTCVRVRWGGGVTAFQDVRTHATGIETKRKKEKLLYLYMVCLYSGWKFLNSSGVWVNKRYTSILEFHCCWL